jgi:hypothetical protein
MLIIEPGSEVDVGPVDDPVNGNVLKVIMIGPPLHVQYEVGWFDGREFHSAVFSNVRLRGESTSTEIELASGKHP